MFSMATALETGCPPKVEPCMNIGAFSLSVALIFSFTTTPPIGRYPLVTPLAKLVMSGTTSKRSMPNHSPRRPNAQITASETSNTPCLSQISRTRFQ